MQRRIRAVGEKQKSNIWTYKAKSVFLLYAGNISRNLSHSNLHETFVTTPLLCHPAGDAPARYSLQRWEKMKDESLVRKK